MNYPKISIITACLNAELFIEQTVWSVLDQGYPNLEYIVIDGGSKDRTLKILQKYCGDIDKLISGPDKGISDAFNKGILFATGDVIGIVSADDCLLPGSLNSVAECYVKSGHPDVIYGSIRFDDFFTHTRTVVHPDPDFSNIWSRQPLKHAATFIAREAYSKYGIFNLKYECAMDYELVLRFFMKGAAFCHLNAILAKVRSGGVSHRRINQTVRETREITVEYGLPKWKANLYYYRKITRVLLRRIILRPMFAPLVLYYRAHRKRFAE